MMAKSSWMILLMAITIRHRPVVDGWRQVTISTGGN